MTVTEVGAVLSRIGDPAASEGVHSSALNVALDGPGNAVASRLQKVDPGADVLGEAMKKVDLNLDMKHLSKDLPPQIQASFQSFKSVTNLVMTSTLATTAVSAGLSAMRRMHQGQ